MTVELVPVSMVLDDSIKNFKKEMLKESNVVHGSNGLGSTRCVEEWRKKIYRLEKNPRKNEVKTKFFFIMTLTQELVGVIDFRYKLNRYQELDGDI